MKTLFTLFTILALSTLFIASSTMAGSGHDHGGGHSHAAEAQAPQKKVQQTTNTKADWKDSITVTIPAKGDKEYKLQVAKGASFDYAWKTDKGELFFDFHGEPKGDKTGYFKTFEKDTKSTASGSLTTEFEGTHGWYWKNGNDFPVIVSLNVKGEYQRLDKEVNRETAEKNAEMKIASLIEKNKLDQSWASIKASSAEKKSFNGVNEWVITYHNKAISEVEKQTLYVYLTIAGDYIAANYTGK